MASGYAPDWGGLQLFRRIGEEVVIRLGTEEVVIVVEAVGGGRCQLRFIAPPTVVIQRAEVVRRMDEEKEQRS
jgi:sRNA-binding carbon storage regulator CsrA